MNDHLVIGGQLGNYLIDSVIGRGGMSVVYRARHSRLGNSVALKVLAPELSVDDTFRERFLREAQMAAAVDHPNVIPIHDMGVHEDSLYIVMRYVSGGDLKDLLRTSSPLEPLRALTLLMPIALALDAAHDHALVHRDVKPANILTQRSKAGDIEHVYLTDFGIAKSAASMTGLTRAGAFIGTVEYMAPEQLEGGEVTAQTDVYAFAATFYECVTGRIPFQRELAEGVRPPRGPLDPVSSVQPGVPAALDAVIERGLSRNPADRHPTCDQFLEACSDALDGRSVDVPAAAAAGVGATELSAMAPADQPPGQATGGNPAWSRTGADETVEPVRAGGSEPPPPAFEPPAQQPPAFEPPAPQPPAVEPPAQPPPTFEPAAAAPPAFEPPVPPPERSPPGDRPRRGFRPWYAVVLVLLLAAAAGAAIALSSKSSTPPGKLSATALDQVPTNHVTGTGAATIRLNGNQAAVTVTTTGLDNGAALVHAMHIHAGGKGECPPASAARPHNGHLTISTTDGINYYGPPVTALTTKGDTSPASILAFPRFLTGGTLRYTRTITLPENVAADIRADNAVIVVHGIDYDGSGIYSGVLDRSELNTSLPGTATAPALCGHLVAQQTAAALNPGAGGHAGVYTATLALSAAPGVVLDGVFFCHVPEGITAPADARRQSTASAAAQSQA